MNKRFISVLFAFLLVGLLFNSCLYGIKGSGKVVRNERQVGPFGAISVSAGLEVILTQDSVVKVIVEADDNLQKIIKTEVSNGELKIYPKERISSCEAKKIFVTFKTIHSLEASSGSDVTSKMELKMPSLQLSVSSGANIDLALAVKNLNADGSSGGNVRLTGSAESFEIEGSSGANMKAKDLQTKTCNAGASSGANLKVNVTDKISAQASSGGNIEVKGNPKERNVQKSSGGNVDF